MSTPFENPEYPVAPAPLPTDTLVDSVLILLVLNVAQRLVGFVRAVLFCRWLDADQLGQWDMTFSFLMLAAPLAVLAIPGTFGRYVEYYRQRGQLHVYLRRTTLVCGCLAVGAFATTIVLRRWISSLVFGSEDQSGEIVLAAVSLMAVIAFNYLVELLTALRNIRLVSAMQLLNSVAFAALGVALLLCWRCDAQSVVLSYGGSCLIAAFMAGRWMHRAWKNAPADEPRTHVALWERIGPFAAWILLGNILTNLFGVVDRYMIIHFARLSATGALETVGNYHASRVVPLLLASIAVMLGAMITPHLSHDWELGRRDRVADRLRLFMKVFGYALFAVGTAVLAVAPLLFDVAFQGKYPEGRAVLPWTLIYCTWFGMSLIAQNYLLCAEKAHLSGIALASGLMLSIPLNLVLLPRLGLHGAVLATAAANALSLWCVCRFNRRLGFRLDDGSKLMLVLPMLLCLGPWISMLALALVAADAVWGKSVLSPDERRQLAEGIGDYARRFKLDRWIAGFRRT